MRFSSHDVASFADWSFDRNPLHVDPVFARQTHFGQPIVHGILTVLGALSAAPSFAGPIRALELEFRSAVVPAGDYTAEVQPAGDHVVIGLRTAQQQGVLTIRADLGPPTAPSGPDAFAWAGTALALSSVRQEPVPRTLDELHQGVVVTGIYPAAALSSEWWSTPSGLTATQVRTLALASYITGMELPGLRSLFTRVTVQFHGDAAPGAPLLFRARTLRCDKQFRLLDTEVLVADAGGRPVATATLRGYVPFSPVTTDLRALGAQVRASERRLRGRTALVLGASRGLGADIAAALALAGARVYASARHDDPTARAVCAHVEELGGQLELLVGDAGETSWCDATRQALEARHQRLDILVLNACAAPTPVRIGRDAARQQNAYIRENLVLIETPLATFLDWVDRSEGSLVFVSSSFVADAPRGFGHYVALKQAGEGLTRTAARESGGASAVIARPPVLQTRWNDTPAGAAGAVPSARIAAHLANHLAEPRQAGQVDQLDDFPVLDAPTEAEEGIEDPSRDAEFSLCIAASFTTDALLPGLRFWLKELDVDGAVEVAPYGQVLQTLLDPNSVFAAKKKGLNVVLLRLRDWLRELADDQAASIDFVRPYLRETASEVERAFKAHSGRAGNDTLLVLCPSLGGTSSAENILLRQTETELAAALTGVSGLTVVSAEDFHPLYDVNPDEIGDLLREEIAHIPYRDPYLHVLATIVARHMFRRLAPPRKVVVVDCDNTLWRGVVGEVGPEGVEFDSGHRALHEMLVRLSSSGVLVCLCSKNEESDVWRVFETRGDFALRREHIVAAAINWQPKSQNIRALASRLSLGIDSFVFLDDNPVECAEVRAGCPEVLTLQWPQDAGRAETLVRHVWEFDGRPATREDQRRTQMYREEVERQDLRQHTLTFEDFIKNLQLTVDEAPLSDDDVRRSAQLTLRTNQFNFTTIRREESDLQSLRAAGQHEIRTIRVKDRFGDYGLVGLVIAERGSEVWNLDTFLLSCRVLGRGVEHQILAGVGEMAQASGARAVRMRVDFTKRNTPARSFLEAVVEPGMRKVHDGGFEAEVPADVLASLTFEPTGAAQIEVPADGETAPAGWQAVDATRLRHREEQVSRAAFELGSMLGLQTAVDGRGTVTPRGVPAVDVAEVVYGAFARALRVPAQTIKDVDRLEALGCDSLRIVEITVALSEQFPWLPSTLLFEHRAASQIVREIERLAAGSSEKGDTRPAPARAGEPAVSTEIAVVGMHIRCAGADSLDELWDLLAAGRSAVRPVPATRPAFLRPLTDDRPHWAGLLEDPARFDAEFFGVSPREAEYLDPQLRLFLEVAWGAIEDAGCAGVEHDPSTGVFVGVMYGDYGMSANHGEARSTYRCWEGFSLANRLSQLLDFHGPSLAVDTACSSSGTALHLACRALSAGDCRVAVVGGVNLILEPDRLASLGRLGILSSRGVCEPFGADADGTVLGEGCAVVVLRPLRDAIARGDRIYGVVKGTGLSTGSGTVGFTAPNPQAQSEAIRRALEAARVDPRTISYVETHGTGTALGDPIEVRGLALAYGDPGLRDATVSMTPACGLGSIKPNVGHMEAGAGVVGLVKVCLQLSRRTLLPSLTSATPNPQIPFGHLPFRVQRSLEPWHSPTAKSGGRTLAVPRRAGLSSFGVGGANAHVIVEEAPELTPPVADASAHDRPAHVIAVSGKDAEALADQAGARRAGLGRMASTDLADFAFTANTGRRHLERRAAVIAGRLEDAIARLEAVASGDAALGAVVGDEVESAPQVAFLFTGQGSQFAGMGKRLYETQPVFRETLDHCAAVFDRLLDRPLLDLLFAEKGTADAALLDQTGYTQPALFAFQVALAELWKSWGVRPDVVMGHSVGEIAALCVAGVVSLEDGLTLIAARGRLMQALPPGGGMASVMAAEAQVIEAIAGREEVAIAAVNSPTQVVISGAESAVREIAATLAAGGIKSKALTVSHAFHSPLMKPMLAEYERVVRTIRFTTPRIPFVSCVNGAFASDELLAVDYWRRQVLEPVRFAAGMRALAAHGVGACIEIGPQPVLLGLGRQCMDETETRIDWLPSLRAETDPWDSLLPSLCTLYVRGVEVDWRGFDAPYRRRRVAVPAYAFKRTSYWLRAPRVVDQPVISTRPRAADLYVGQWQPSAAAVPASDTVRDYSWVVLSDRTGVGEALTNFLSARGVAVLQVTRGDRFRRVDGTSCTIDPASLEDHVHALTAHAQGVKGQRIVHLWTLDAGDLDSDATTTVLDRAVAVTESVLQVIRALRAIGGTGQTSVWCVTGGAAVVEPGNTDVPVSVLHAPVWGLGQTIGLEFPSVWGGLIDLPSRGGDALVEDLVAHVLQPGVEDRVALRPAGRWVARLTGRTDGARGTTRLQPDRTYLVTGGLGTLGTRLAGWLADHGARHVVLTGRRGSVDATAALAIQALERQGVRVTVTAADVGTAADVDLVLSRIAATDAPLGGIVHAAGVDSPIDLANLTAGDLRESMVPKVAGSWLLHARTRNLPLDLFVMFSSLASVLGANGRAHYAAANAFMDGLAHERRRQGLPALAVNWGPWSGGGMATEEHLVAFESIGNYGLDPAAALDALDRALSTGEPQVSVASIDWARFTPAYEARRPRPLVSSLRPLAESRPAAPARSAVGSSHDGRGPWVERLMGIDVPQREEALRVLVRSEVAAVLGLDDAARLAITADFYDVGMDSLMTAELVARLNQQVGVSSGAAVIDNTSVATLAAALLKVLALPDQPEAPTTERGPSGPAAASGAGMVEYAPQRDPAIQRFQEEAFPDRDPKYILPRFRWMFLESAARVARTPAVWLYEDAGRIVGQMGAIPVRLKVGQQILSTSWLVDTMVLDGYRGQALGSRLMMEARKSVPFALSLGQSPEMREIQFRLGWKQVAPLQIAQLLIRPDRVLKGKLPAPVAWAAGLGFRASTAVRDLLRDRPSTGVREVTRFGNQHDALWASMSDDVTCGVIRDASYLNWKYVDQPGQQFLRIELTEGDQVKAVAVCLFREPDASYQYRRAFLVDLVVPFSDRRLTQQILRAAAAAVAEAGADTLVCHYLSAPLGQMLTSLGFLWREPERFLLVDPGPVSGTALDQLLDGRGWYLTQGDSDIDRP